MTSTASEQRVVFAFFAQPLVAALLAFSLFPVIEYTARPLHGGRSVDMLDGAIAVAAGAFLAAVFVVGLGAVPAYVWLGRRGPITRTKVLISGALLGNLPGVVILILQAITGADRREVPGPSGLAYGFAGAIRAVLIASLVGAAAALVFWWMAGLRRKETP